MMVAVVWEERYIPIASSIIMWSGSVDDNTMAGCCTQYTRCIVWQCANACTHTQRNINAATYICKLDVHNEIVDQITDRGYAVHPIHTLVLEPILPARILFSELSDGDGVCL